MIKGTKVNFEWLARERRYKNAGAMFYNLYKIHTSKEMGKILGVTCSAVIQRLHFHGIKMRSRGSAGRIKRR